MVPTTLVWFRALLLPLTMLAVLCVRAHAQELKRNPFDDPFIRVTNGFAGLPGT